MPDPCGPSSLTSRVPPRARAPPRPLRFWADAVTSVSSPSVAPTSIPRTSAAQSWRSPDFARPHAPTRSTGATPGMDPTVPLRVTTPPGRALRSRSRALCPVETCPLSSRAGDHLLRRRRASDPELLRRRLDFPLPIVPFLISSAKWTTPNATGLSVSPAKDLRQVSRGFT
ncbi:vegetative cell wall protein gp1-like [Iris pallida]|uniref:Vegetative cell wall protein gp1-like n=1 Tax=Iris pallida TaxID=29817 RepID=A0AAX6HTM2_IRIPA|nr:vegetative cell wall protein gp1-like [Iris pallida]